VHKRELSKALGQVNESISTNTANNSATNLKASILRNLGDIKGAQGIIEATLAKDPLDFRAGNEKYLLSLKSGDKTAAETILSDLKKKMRGSDQNYLELAVGYIDDGFNQDAEDILTRYEGQNQEIKYYLGYLQARKGNRTEAEKLFRAASASNIDYGFPFRLESVDVYKMAFEFNPSDPKPYYYLGNLYFDKQPAKAINYWEKAVSLDPSMAIAWRNLGFGYFNHFHDLGKAIGAYEKAVSGKTDDPIYYAELDPLYELNNTSLSTRAKLFESRHDVVKQRDESFVREIMVLNLSGASDKAVEYLKNSTFHFREGSLRVRDITADAYVLYGRKLLAEKKFPEALEQFKAVLEAPDKNDKKGITADPRNPQINYFIGLTLEASGRKSEAKKYFLASKDQLLPDTGHMMYYQGLSLLKLGDKTGADAIFKSLISEGEKRLSSDTEVDFFAKFGEKEADNVRKSNAYLLQGLGYKGLGDKEKASEKLRKASELSASNLWAGVESD
jgi:tetratricopeptide (TPR) repeat protein